MNMKKALVGVCMAAMTVVSATAADKRDDIFTDGEFFVGCNYWARHAGMYMWRDWRPDEVARELEALSREGVTVMRVFPLWSDFQPLTGDCYSGGDYRSYRFRDNRDLPNPAGVDDEMVARFRTFCGLAEKNGIRLIVGLVTGWMSGRQFVPEVFEEKPVLSDPEAIMWQTRFVKHFVRATRDCPAIVAWDYGNECNCMGKASTAEFYNWMDHIGMAIRACDPTRPVVSGMHGLSTDPADKAPIRLNGELSDILCTHPYAYYVAGCGKEAFNTMRTALHPTAESVLYRDLGGKPCFVEEVGNLSAAVTSDARSAAGVRTMLFSAWANDLKGLLWWCNSDQEGLDFPPYTLTACERELGLLRDDFSPKPVMQEMKAFQAFRASLPFKKLPRAKHDAVVVVPETEAGWIPAFGAYLLARQAGLNVAFAGAEAELPDAPFYVVCSATTDATYTYRAQKRLRAKAEAGATVLILYSGEMRFTRLAEYAGVSVDYCCHAPIERKLTLAAHPDRPIVVSDASTCRLLATGADVLGKDADGEPLFTCNRAGRGKVVVCNAPIDRQAVDRTDVISGRTIRPYYLVLAEAAKLAGVKGAVTRGDCPQVGITEHPAADGRTIVMAINFEPREVACPIAVNGTLGRVWRGDVGKDRIVLAPNEAALFEVVR